MPIYKHNEWRIAGGQWTVDGGQYCPLTTVHCPPHKFQRAKYLKTPILSAHMAKLMPRSSEEKKIKFAVEEILLSFIGALILSFGVLVLLISHVDKICFPNGPCASMTVDWPSFILVIFIAWLGLLLFTVPIVRKIEQLM